MILRILLLDHFLGACAGSPDSFKEKLPFPLYNPTTNDIFIHLMQALFSTWVRFFTDVFFKDVGSFCSLPPAKKLGSLACTHSDLC